MLFPTRYRNTIKLNTLLILFSLFNFFIFLGDAIMSYATPVFLDTKLNNTFLLGLVFSLSSLIGFFFDFIAGERLGNKNYAFFIKGTLIFSIIFPLCFLLFPNNFLFYILGLAAWGIYYETNAFANFRFVEHTQKKEDFSEIWSWIMTIEAIAYFTGPLLATFLLNYFIEYNFYAAIAAFSIAIIIYFFIKLNPSFKDKVVKIQTSTVSARIELKRWYVLFKKLWPVWIFGVVLFMIDAFFWTIGIVYAESLKDESPIAGLMLSIYMIPTIIVGAIMSRIQIKKGKKRLMLIFSVISGFTLSFFAATKNIGELFIIISLYSVFSSITINLLKATYEDYVARTDTFENDVIGMQQSAGNIAYIIGPIIGGGLALIMGEKMAISSIGYVLVLVGLISIIIIPRKIRLPQKELSQIS